MFQLALARMREFYREPEAVFWVFGFPIVLAFALGLAFRNTGPGELQVGVARGPGDSALAATLDSSPRLIAAVLDTATARLRLRTGRVALLVVAGDSLVYRYDSTRTESRLARLAGNFWWHRRVAGPWQSLHRFAREFRRPPGAGLARWRSPPTRRNIDLARSSRGNVR